MAIRVGAPPVEFSRKMCGGRGRGHSRRRSVLRAVAALMAVTSVSATMPSGIAATRAPEPGARPRIPPTTTVDQPPDESQQDAGPADPQHAAQPAEQTVVIVEGQVTDQIGAGQRDVTVSVRRKGEGGSGGELLASAVTGDLGDFVVTAPAPVYGEIVVTFTKPKYRALVRELHLGQGESAPFLAESLEGDLVIAGWVVDAGDERPISKATITLKALYKDWHAATDAHGRFTIPGVSPGRGELVVEAPGYGRERRKIATLDQPGDIAIRLEPERVVNLEVVDDLGKPVAGAIVEVYDESRDDFRTQISDEKGMVVIQGIHFAAESLSVRITHKEHVSSELFDREVVVFQDQPESPQRLVLVRGGRIVGTVTDKRTGAPLNGARVMTGEGASRTSPRDWTDFEGKYEIRGVPPGVATITVHLPGYAPTLETPEVRAGGMTRLDLGLVPGATLEGVVRNESGEPVAGVRVETVRWRGYATLDLRAVTGDHGRFVIGDVPHDEFEIRVEGQGIRGVKKSVTAGVTNPVQITVSQVSPVAPPYAGPGPQVGETVAELTMTTLTGRSLDLAKLKGKVVVLDFWAIWCVPCVAELPDLASVYKRFGTRDDFIMIGVSLDFDEKTLRGFLKKHKVAWPQVYGEKGGAEAAASKFGVVGVPAIFIVGSDGRIVASRVHAADIRKHVEKLLTEGVPE